jgi:hypothetical protein
MFVSLLAAICFSQDPRSISPTLVLHNLAGRETGYVEQVGGALEHPQLSPKIFGNERWLFSYETVAYEKLIPGTSYYARFYVFSQNRTEKDDVAVSVTRMLERLWEFLYSDLHLDHSNTFGNYVVDVYLCDSGRPGGEQRFEEDRANGKHPFEVNSIYIYDMPTFKDPMEMAREVAHEYGHATLTGVNGYSDPEDWANGYLGEKVYLKHVLEGMKSGELHPADAMGATQTEIQAWIDKNVQPLVVKAALEGPSVTALKRRDKIGMDNFLGLAMYMDYLLPTSLFSQSLTFLPSSKAEDYIDAITIAAQPAKNYTLTIPDFLAGKPIWVPLGSNKLTGAKILARRDEWVKILPGPTVVEIVPTQ